MYLSKIYKDGFTFKDKNTIFLSMENQKFISGHNSSISRVEISGWYLRYIFILFGYIMCPKYNLLIAVVIILVRQNRKNVKKIFACHEIIFHNIKYERG